MAECVAVLRGGNPSLNVAALGDRALYDDCGASIDCMNQRSQAELSRTMTGMFDEAGASLAGALSGKPGAGKPGSGAQPAPGDSVDDTIKKILQGK